MTSTLAFSALLLVGTTAFYFAFPDGIYCPMVICDILRLGGIVMLTYCACLLIAIMYHLDRKHFYTQHKLVKASRLIAVYSLCMMVYMVYSVYTRLTIPQLHWRAPISLTAGAVGMVGLTKMFFIVRQFNHHPEGGQP